MEKDAKKSISYVIPRNHGSHILLVQRPADDENLPNVWGLPAGTLKDGEQWEDAVRRSGEEKLGVELSVGECINEGTLDRGEYVLHMRLYRASIPKGNPSAPQEGHPDVTQYQRCDWFTPDEATQHMLETAPKGSLCCMLWLCAAGEVDETFLREHNAELLSAV